MGLIKVNRYRLSVCDPPQVIERWVNLADVSYIEPVDVEGMKNNGWLFGKHEVLFRIVMNHHDDFFTDKDGLLNLTSSKN